MELPEYRLPQAANVLKQMWERGKAFLLKAGTVILTASIILWLLQNFNFRFEFAETDNSILAEIGKFISPVFTPLGFNDRGYGWQFSVATLTGIFAKGSNNRRHTAARRSVGMHIPAWSLLFCYVQPAHRSVYRRCFRKFYRTRRA